MTAYQGETKIITVNDNGKNKYVFPITMADSVFFSDGTSLQNKSFSSGGSRIAGKSLYIIGDSITARDIFQKTLVNDFGLAKYFNCSGNGIPIGGSGMAKKFSGGFAIDKSYDMCMMLLGTNDAHYAISKGDDGTYNYLNLGTINDDISLFQTSFYAAVKYVCEKMITNFKGKPILIVAPPQRSDYLQDSDGRHVNEYLRERVAIIEEVARKYSIAYLDLFNCHSSQIILSDGIHPSGTAGMFELGKLIGNKLCSLV